MHQRRLLVVTLSLVLVSGLCGYVTPTRTHASSSAVRQCVDLVKDGSFEAGYWRDWTPSGGAWMADYWSHAGSWSAVVGGENNASHAFFQDGMDVSQQSQLFGVAERAGVDLAGLERVMESGAAHAQLAADIGAAAKIPVRASPTLMLNENRQLLAGNVGYRVLEASVRELLRSPDDQRSWC